MKELSNSKLLDQIENLAIACYKDRSTFSQSGRGMMEVIRLEALDDSRKEALKRMKQNKGDQ